MSSDTPLQSPQNMGSAGDTSSETWSLSNPTGSTSSPIPGSRSILKPRRSAHRMRAALRPCVARDVVHLCTGHNVDKSSTEQAQNLLNTQSGALT